MIKIAATIMVMILLVAPVMADHCSSDHGKEDATTAAAPAMPEMGVPEQLKNLAFLIGEWTYEGEMQMAPTCEGAIIRYDFVGDMMPGMPTMTGLGLMAYDRGAKEWVQTWSDNFMAGLSRYTGQFKDGEIAMTGVDNMGGMMVTTRVTTFDIEDNTFKWKMEHSMDEGKTWWLSMKGVYTKK